MISIFELYPEAYQKTGTAGTVPYTTGGTQDSIDIMTALSLGLAPAEDRHVVMDFQAQAKALAVNEISDANKRGDGGDARRRGMIGYLMGQDHWADHAVPTHVNPNGTPTGWSVNAAVNAGEDQVILAGGAATIPIAGDLVTFAGDTQSYSVVEVITSGDPCTLRITPKAQTNLGIGAVATFEGAHKVNLGFQTQGITLATRPILEATSDEDNIFAMTDPLTGMTLRVEKTRQHRRTAWFLDMLWGRGMPFPNCVVRHMGQQ